MQVKFFLVLILSIVITTLVLSLILYINFEKIALNQIETYSTDNLSKVSYSTSFMIDSARMLAIQILNDRDIKNLLYSETVDETEKSLYRIRLSSFKNSTPFIRSLYVYNGSADRIYNESANKFSYSREDFYDKDIFSLIDDQSKVNHLLPVPRIMKGNIPLTVDSFYNAYTIVFYENPKSHSKGDNSIILNIYEDWMKNIITSMDSNYKGNTFIINNKGIMMTKDDKNALLTDISDEGYINKILKSEKPFDYFVDTVNGEKSLVTYVLSKDKQLDWRFVSVIPYKNITGQIDVMKRNTMIICSLLVLLGLLVSYISSRILYKPINNILENLRKLESEKRGSYSSLKQEFLRNLIKAGSQYKPETLNNRFEDFGINLDPMGYFALIIFKIDHYKDFYAKYNYNDRSLFMFAIMNIISELSSVQFKNECVDMGSDHIVLLLNISGKPDDTWHESIHGFVENIQGSAWGTLEISLSCVIGSATQNILGDIGELYSDANEASLYRLFYGRRCILYADNYKRLNSGNYVYPSMKEKALINSLMHRKVDEVVEAYDDIIETTKKYSYAAFNLAVLRITLAIASTVENIEKNNGLSISYDFNEFLSGTNSLETLEDVNNRFYDMFEYIISKLEGRKHSNHDELVNTMIQTLKKQFADENLSIEFFAAKFNMSSVYLGRIFRKFTSKSVAEFISEVRIEKAKELLASTNLPINEITEKIGLSNVNYFYTIFRKLNGITPAEYRQNAHKK